MRYPNYYETIKEARDRLRSTIVLHGGLPYYVLAITDHMKDDNFYVWLDPIGREADDKRAKPFRSIAANYHPDSSTLGELLEAELEASPDSGVLVEAMNSPKFNAFRPFPLGMCNVGTQVYYLERQPIRPQMFQGLTKGAIFETLITAGSRQDNPRRPMETPDIYSPAFKDCILGDHYSAKDVLEALQTPTIAHDALVFHREFALVRGPIDMLFLAYRSDIIGVLPNNDFGMLRLGREFRYCREVVAELNLFNNIE